MLDQTELAIYYVNRIEQLEKSLRQAAGLISTMEQYSHWHPMEVYEELLRWGQAEEVSC